MRPHTGAQPATTGGHPYDYYYRPGMPLRPPPPRAVASELWYEPRKAMLSPWMTVRREPRDTPRTRLLADHLWQGDEPMDEVVAAFGRLGTAGGRRMLNRALEHGIDSVDDPPVELVNLFARIDNPPQWYDPDRWEYGRRLWINVSTAGKMAMGVQDFMGTFVGAEVASAVGETGRFVKDPYRRNLESAVWFGSVTAPVRWSAAHRFCTTPFACGSCTLRCVPCCAAAGARSTSPGTGTRSPMPPPWVRPSRSV